MAGKTQNLLTILELQPVIPVLTIENIDKAVPLARALVAGHLKAIEVTLRTPMGLDAIRAINDQVEGAIVGAGTVLNAIQYEQAVTAGARFIVSPGTTYELIDCAKKSEIPMLPGAATVSEIMALREEGYKILKFFPAEQAGGTSYLKSLCSPLPDMIFCPTGGIHLKNAKNYLSLPNVVCVGGSWIAPQELITTGDWHTITKIAHEAFMLND